MPTNTDPQESIERFAEIAATLHYGLADRAATLRAVGLDESSWKALQGRWHARIATLTAAEAKPLLQTYLATWATSSRTR
jgi:hypothetical protein